MVEAVVSTLRGVLLVVLLQILSSTEAVAVILC